MSLPRELVASVDRLDPLPVTIQTLVAKRNDDMVSPREVARIVEYDQALVATILRAANSAALRGHIRVNRISDAVLRMGIDQILTAAMGTHLRHLKVPLPLYDLAEDDFWYHSAVSSLAAQELMASHPDIGIPSTAPVAALMHDIGKLIIVRHAHVKAEQVASMAEERAISFVEAEREILGFDHCEVGAAMAERWGLPEEIRDAIAFHHTTPIPEPSPLLDAVMIANMVAKTLGAGLGAECVNVRNDPKLLNRMGLVFDDFSRLCSDVLTKADDLRALYGLPPA